MAFGFFSYTECMYYLKLFFLPFDTLGRAPLSLGNLALILVCVVLSNSPSLLGLENTPTTGLPLVFYVPIVSWAFLLKKRIWDIGISGFQIPFLLFLPGKKKDIPRDKKEW